jgi:hypothetical protein
MFFLATAISVFVACLGSSYVWQKYAICEQTEALNAKTGSLT